MGKALCGQESDELIFLVLLVHHYINDAIYILLIIKVSKKKIMSPIKTITLVDGVKVCVPDSLHLISSYVLEEQLDWFEDEIKFIRAIIHCGNCVIDIGANYGVYTLSIAKLIGSTGKIYAFEPANETADMLLKSIQINEFKNIVFEKKGLSKEIGMANLSLNDNSEFNSLVSNMVHMGPSELVKITTLDECMKLFDWGKIDFIKIDAEGEEGNIIQGGLDFFRLKSPLVMFEIKAANQVNLDLVNQFELLEYKTFKLIPGLNILAPYRKNEVADGYLLNLFCCKSDRAKLLSDQRVLILDEIDESETLNPINISLEKIAIELPFDNHFLLSLPYAKQLRENWKINLRKFNPLLIKSLNLYQQSKMAQSANEKYRCLMLAFNSMSSLCKLNSCHLRLSTLARIAKELGYRSVAVTALDMLRNNILSTKTIWVSEPFLLPSDEYEIIDPKDQIINFIWSSLLSSLEKIEYFSSFFAGQISLDRSNEIIGTGFFSDEISRRRDLIIKRYELT